MQSYDYANRQGIEDVSWQRFATLAATLTERLAPSGIDAVVGIARAGLFPATSVACTLRRDLYPVKLSRRISDQVTFQHPVWKINVSPDVKNKIVAVVDEITDTGETLALVAEAVRQNGAAKVVTAALVSHSWAKPMPDHVALVTDALVIFPWDRQVYMDGRWQIHPELAAALRLQGKDAE
jgi:hypoxanthine phosphoribosyltransferase